MAHLGPEVGSSQLVAIVPATKLTVKMMMMTSKVCISTMVAPLFPRNGLADCGPFKLIFISLYPTPPP